MPSLSTSWAHFFPPKPRFTDKDLPDLQGKVYMVTGSNTGLGREVARMLYAKNATVYMAARSETKARDAMAWIRDSVAASSSSSTGSLAFLHLDLSDLDQVRTAAQSFLARESRLHVLFNNAGLMATDPLTRTAQGHEMALGVNCVGTFLFTRLLTPTLAATARTEPAANTVRVVWLSSFGLELYAPRNRGISLDNLDYHRPVPDTERYGISKCGDWALGVEFARRHRDDGIISIPINPGNLRSELARNHPILAFLVTGLCYPVPMGACTEIFAGLSPEVTMEKSGSWVAPFGRFYPLRPDLENATKTEAEGGTGGNYHFWEWCEDQVKAYL